MTDATVRIAMWSGPRNISTALMRSWGSRPDTFVCDEPLYAYYLEQTGVDHPRAPAIIAHYETDWRTVVASLTGPVPQGKRIFYQKHMTHHVLPEVSLDWLDGFVNCFLIRDPREVITSLGKVVPHLTLEDTGLPRQVKIFGRAKIRSGQVPPVIDARDVLRDPASILSKLCARIGVPYTDDMLRWPPGPRPTDGIWAPNWYQAVERSTGFTPYQPKDDPIPDHLLGLLEQCDELYQQLYRYRIT